MTERTYLSKPILHRVCRAFVTSVFAMSLTTIPASAASCIDQVRDIAHDFKLDIDPPDAGSVITPEDLAQSGGVIEPPSVGDPALIEPPTPNSAMPTTPKLPPTGQAGVGPLNLSPGDRLLLEGILTSARAEARRGDVDGCFRRLQKAQELIRDRGGKLSGG